MLWTFVRSKSRDLYQAKHSWEFQCVIVGCCHFVQLCQLTLESPHVAGDVTCVAFENIYAWCRWHQTKRVSSFFVNCAKKCFAHGCHIPCVVADWMSVALSTVLFVAILSSYVNSRWSHSLHIYKPLQDWCIYRSCNK